MTAMRTVESVNPYLEGFLAPVAAEMTVTDLKVTGHIPEHLDGRYLRNGPNPVAEVDPAIYHWFSGDAMVHGLALRDGITCLNSPGTIDSDYRGEVSVILANLGQKPVSIARGDRIAQMVIAPVARAELVESAALPDTSRGAGGFGHTGR